MKLATSLMLLALLALLAFDPANSSPVPTDPTQSQTTVVRTPTIKLVADDNTAQCLAKCRSDFERCSDGGKKNVPECIKKRTECINKCK